MKFSRLTLCTVTAAMLLATGCASTKSADTDKPMSVEDISKQWKKGNDMVAKGETVKRKAQEKIDAANMQMKDGDALVSQGKTMMADSEQAFRDTSRRTKSN